MYFATSIRESFAAVNTYNPQKKKERKKRKEKIYEDWGRGKKKIFF